MSSEKQSCQGFFGWLFGHSYDPRYNTTTLESKLHHVPPSPVDLGALVNDLGSDESENEALDTVEKMHRNGNDTCEQIYVCDICGRCGHVVKP